MMNAISGKRILVTGVCGTVGSELIDLLLADDELAPSEVIGIDNNESELFFLEQRYVSDERARFSLADVRDSDQLLQCMQGVDIVFHSAALKHVVMCERTPFEAVQTNIHGVKNIIHAANVCGVEKAIFTSSDKAVNPTNVMGTTKLMGERLFTAANSSRRSKKPVYASTRFGNVLGSRGSVVPIFERQIALGGPVTLTDDKMTRFVMTVRQAVQLVVDSANIARGGEVFITKMPVVRISDLAAAMIEVVAPLYGYDPASVKTKIIGMKPGEKLYEELMSQEETRRAVELPSYFSVLPAFRGLYRNIEYDYVDVLRRDVQNAYVSSNEESLSVEQTKSFLMDNGLVGVEKRSLHPSERYWPEDKNI